MQSKKGWKAAQVVELMRHMVEFNLYVVYVLCLASVDHGKYYMKIILTLCDFTTANVWR